ncbi:hypothetical protein PVL29_000779 [Vitis rotundifolia]|uniref:Uncharacterized protein n=1 Tax=Vitis rotundifolia TaxID=103349 RepID=A0AA39E739_VITRO|nr:hypothetical protein PVL29_000779 [Vitis rotundifolia]
MMVCATFPVFVNALKYFQNTQGLIFVVDNNDRDQVVEARNELHRMLNEDELCDAVLLVFGTSRAPVQPLVKGFTRDWIGSSTIMLTRLEAIEESIPVDGWSWM